MYSHSPQNIIVTRAIVVAKRECSGHPVILILRVTLLLLWLHRWERVSIQPGMGSLIDDTCCRRVRATRRGRRPPLFPETVATQPPSSRRTDPTLSVLVITQSPHKRASPR